MGHGQRLWYLLYRLQTQVLFWVIYCNHPVSLSVRASIWNYGLELYMKTVAKLLIGVRVCVIVGLCKLINTAVPAN